MSTTDTTAHGPPPRRDAGPEEAVDTAIDEACRALHLPTIRSRVQEMGADAVRQRSSYKDFLADLLEAECAEERAVGCGRGVVTRATASASQGERCGLRSVFPPV